MKSFIQLTNNRSCLLRADEIKADYAYMTEPRKENDYAKECSLQKMQQSCK